MELPIVHRGDLAPAERSKLWGFAWQKRTGIGAIDESRAHYPTSGTIWPAHDRADHGASRNRACTGAEAEDDVQRLSQPTLGVDCSHGFLHRGSVDSARAAAN